MKTKLKGYDRAEAVVTFSEISKMKDRIIEQERIIGNYRTSGRESREIREIRENR